MATLFPLLLLLLPIGEIAVFILAGDIIGFWYTLGLIIVTAMIGLSLIRLEGLATLQRFQDRLAEQEFPESELFNMAAILFAGLLLLIPGFITDVLGLLILIPGMRTFLRSRVFHHLSASGFVFVKSAGPGRSGQGQGAGKDIIEGDFTVIKTDEDNKSALPPSSREDK